MFSKADKDELLEELRTLRKEVAGLKGERDAVKEERSLLDDVVSLKQQITELEIKRDRLVEDHEREKREVKHMVGLEKKRQEFEIDQAKRETGLTVREENLTADKRRFEEQMQFQNERFEQEVGYLKGLMEQVLTRLPTVTWEASTGSNGNGYKETADAAG